MSLYSENPTKHLHKNDKHSIWLCQIEQPFTSQQSIQIDSHKPLIVLI